MKILNEVLLNEEILYNGAFKSMIEEAIDRINIRSNNIAKLSLGDIKGKRPIVVKIYGGLNGCGEWTNYFDCLSDLLKLMQNEYNSEMWLIKLDNDCLDDVFSAEFGAKRIK